MQVSHTLRKEIVDFFVSLPGIHDSGTRQALIYNAGLDSNLLAMIHFDGPPAQFFPLLLPTLTQYGKLADGREALVAVLEATEQFTGPEGRAECERLIRAISPSSQNGTPENSGQAVSLTADERNSPASQPTKILFLSAVPNNQVRLQTDREHRTIMAEMDRGRHRDAFEFLPPQFAVTITELLRAMNDKPNIVHFSGHGKKEGILISTDDNKTQSVSIRALQRLFKPLKGITKLVLLNSCYSAEQAKTISEYGMFVIGMNDVVTDKAALSFAKGLYNALGEGKSFEPAYNDAMIVLETEYPDSAEAVEVWKDGERLDI